MQLIFDIEGVFFIKPEKWTGKLIGNMHVEGITYDDLAKELEVTKAYVSMILNGRKRPPNARERLEAAFAAVLERKKAETQE